MVAGDSAKWERSISDYPPSAGWTLRYHMARPLVEPVVVEATPDPTAETYRVNLAAAITATWTPGEYHWKALVSKAGERHQIVSGTLQILPDPTVVHDPRTADERALDAITAVLEGRLGESIAEYTVGGTPVKHMDHGTLIRLQGFYQARVRMQRGGTFAVQIPVRLTR